MKKHREKKINVLFILRYFPPVHFGAVARSLKFVKYISNFGYFPFVLTVKVRKRAWFSLDTELLKELKNIKHKIIRTFSFDIDIFPLVRKASQISANFPLNKNDSIIKRFSASFFYFLKSLTKFFFIPDAYIGWLPFAVFSGYRAIKKNNIKIIFSSYPPGTSHIVGMLLKKITGIIWVVDFRDAWVDDPLKPHTLLNRFIIRFFEKKTINLADAIISISEDMNIDFMKRYKLSREKFFEIPNGYDPEDFSNFRLENFYTKKNRLQEKDKLVISYAGSFFSRRNPVKFLKAISDILSEKTELIDKIEFRAAGNFGYTNYASFMTEELAKIVKFKGYVSHSTSIKYMLSSDLLLLIISDQPGSEKIVTGKIFEYLYAKKPIFAIIPDKGLAADILRKSGNHIICPSSTEEIKKAFIIVLEKWQNGRLIFKNNIKYIKKFNRKLLTKRLADIFDYLIVINNKDTR